MTDKHEHTDPIEDIPTTSEAEAGKSTKKKILKAPPAKSQAMLTDVGTRAVSYVMRDAMVKGLLTGFVTGEASKRFKNKGIGLSVLGFAAAKIATRSVPGAMAVGAGLLAKTLYDRKKEKAQGKLNEGNDDQHIENETKAISDSAS